MSTDAEVAYTREGLRFEGVVVYPEVIADWFEQYRLVDEYFRYAFDDHDDCVSQDELDRALKNQRNRIWQNLGDLPYNYHDDNKHPGAIRWCTDAACDYVSRVMREEDLG